MQYDESFAVGGAKIGDSLRIRLPNDFTVATGPALQVQDTAEQSTTLVLATQKHVDVNYSTMQRTMQLDDYSRRVLAPMVNNLTGAVAVDIMSGSEGGISNFVANQDVNNVILSPIASTYLNSERPPSSSQLCSDCRIARSSTGREPEARWSSRP